MAAPPCWLIHTRILCRLCRNITVQASLASSTNDGAEQRILPVFSNVRDNGQAAQTPIVTRQYSRTLTAGTGATDHDSEEEPRVGDDGKKRTRKKTRKRKSLSSQPESGITLSFPFEGEGKKIDATTNTDPLASQANSSFTAQVVNQSGGRVYSIHSEGEVYRLPSVTTILSSTLPRERSFMLRNWKQSLVKKRGEGGYREVVDKTRVLGIQFHKALEAKLHNPHLLSVKAQAHQPSPPPTPPPYSPLPPPLPFPPNYPPPTLTSTSNNSDTLLEDHPDKREEGKEEEEEEEEEEGEKPSSREGVTCHAVEGHSDGSTAAKDEASTESESSQGYLESVRHVLEDITEVWALESIVAHLELGYSGTCDCIATYRGAVCLIDWKTSSRPRPQLSDLYDYPLQAVAYAGAVNQDPTYPFKVENVLIVVAYPSGEPGHTHLLHPPDCQHYWRLWLDRLLAYQTLFATDMEDVLV